MLAGSYHGFCDGFNDPALASLFRPGSNLLEPRVVPDRCSVWDRWCPSWGAVVVWAAIAPSGCTTDAEKPLREPIADLVKEAGQTYRASAGLTDVERTVVIATQYPPVELDPMAELSPWAQRVVDDVLFQGLTRRLANSAPFAEPDLADRCDLSPPEHPRVVYCHVPDKLEFHDGSPVTMDDVVYSLTYWLGPRHGLLRLRYGLLGLTDVDVVDGPPGDSQARDPDRWVRIAFSSSDALLLERISAMKIVPKTAHRGRSQAFAKAPIGTGPMRVTSMDSDRLVLEHTHAQDEGTAKIIFERTTDRAEGLIRLRRGEVHVLDAVAPVHIPAELAKPGMAPRLDAFRVTPPQFDVIVYNLREGAQSGPMLRGALDQAIPYHAIDEAYGEPSAPVSAPVDLTDPQPIDLVALENAGPSARWGMAGLPTISVDEDALGLEAAARVLDDLGWAVEKGHRRQDGGSLRVTLMWDGQPGVGSAVASMLRRSWRSLGVQVPQATASWSYVFGLMRDGRFDLALVRYGTRSDQDLRPWFHSHGEANLSGIADDDLDQALEDYAEARTRAERDAAKLRVAQRLDALRPVTVIHAPTRVMLISKRLSHGLRWLDDQPALNHLRLKPEQAWTQLHNDDGG